MNDVIDFNKSLDSVQDVKIFLGDYDGIQRYDRRKYPITDNLTKVQQSSIWFPKEINFSKDVVGINILSETHREIYRANLLFQTIADSYANRFLDGILMEFITSPEWESVLKWQALFELIHSEAYSENIRKVFSDAEAFFNEGFKNPEIRNRLELEIGAIKRLIAVRDNPESTDQDLKEMLMEVVIRQYALENIRFMVSFLYTQHLNEINEQVLQGSVNNIALILNDETIHTTIFKHLINILKDNPSEGFTSLFVSNYVQDKAIEVFKEVIESELQWFKYLASIEEFEGFTEIQVRQFLNFYASKALDGIKVPNDDFAGDNRNQLVEFFENKRNLNATKSLAQETEVLTYNIGALEDKAFHTADLMELFNSYKRRRP